MTKLFTQREVREIVGVSDTTLYRWEELGTFPPAVRGAKRGKKFWTEQSILEWIDRQSTPVNTPPVNITSPSRDRKDYERRQREAAETLQRHRNSRSK